MVSTRWQVRPSRSGSWNGSGHFELFLADHVARKFSVSVLPEVRAVCGQSNSALQRWTIWSWTALSVRQNWLVSFADGPIRSATPAHLISGPGHQVKKRGFLTVMPFTVNNSNILAHPNITFSRKESLWNSCRVSDSTSSIEETHKSHPI